MAQITICDFCGQQISKEINKKNILINEKEVTLTYNTKNEGSNESGFYFNYDFDICLHCMKKIMHNFFFMRKINLGN